jgi:hypothetical protein
MPIGISRDGAAKLLAAPEDPMEMFTLWNVLLIPAAIILLAKRYSMGHPAFSSSFPSLDKGTRHPARGRARRKWDPLR